jgi:hypothetical protein
VPGTHTKASEYNHVDARWENNANQKVLSVTFIISTVIPRSTTQGFVLCVALTTTFHKATWNHCHNNHDSTSNHCHNNHDSTSNHNICVVRSSCTYSKTCTVVRLWRWGARASYRSSSSLFPACYRESVSCVSVVLSSGTQPRQKCGCLRASLRTWPPNVRSSLQIMQSVWR